MIEKMEETDRNYVYQGESDTTRETVRNIVFIPGKAKISALPS